jgi:hypothetical protein
MFDVPDTTNNVNEQNCGSKLSRISQDYFFVLVFIFGVYVST